MPQAPEYGQQKIALNPLPQERFSDQAPIGAFGGGQTAEAAAQATRGLGEAAFKLANEEWQHGNQLRVLDADNSLNSVEAGIKTNGFAKRGKDAMGILEPSLAEFDKQATKIASGLQNDEQKISFQHAANNRRFMLELTLGLHMDNEIKSFDHQTMLTGVQNASDEAIANYTMAASKDPVDQHLFQFQLEKQRAIITDYAKNNGLPTDVTKPEGAIYKNMMLNALSATHGGVIKQFAENGMSEVGQEYLKANRADMAPKDVSASEDMIRRRLPQDVASRVYANAPKLSDGSPDRVMAQKIIAKVPGLDEEQRVNAFSAFEAFANHDAYGLKRNNEANDTQFYSKAVEMSNAGKSVEDQKKLADSLAARLPDGRTDNYDVAKKYAFIDSFEAGAAAKNDPETLNALHMGMLDGSITDSAPITKAMKDGLLSRQTAAQLMIQMNSGKSPGMVQQWNQIKASAEGPFPVEKGPGGREEFLGILRAQAIEQKITDPVKLKELYDENVATAPNGESSLFHWLGGDSGPYHESQATIHQNPALVRAMGGGDAVFNLAKQMGGADNFTRDSIYSKAVMALIQRGFKPQEIIPGSIYSVIEKHPSWVGLKSSYEAVPAIKERT